MLWPLRSYMDTDQNGTWPDALIRAIPSLRSNRQATVSNRGSADLTTDRKSTRLNSSHVKISYAVFCLKKKNIIFLLLFAGVAEAQIRLGQSRYSSQKPVDILSLASSKLREFRIADFKAVGLRTLVHSFPTRRSSDLGPMP